MTTRPFGGCARDYDPKHETYLSSTSMKNLVMLATSKAAKSAKQFEQGKNDPLRTKGGPRAGDVTSCPRDVGGADEDG